MRPTVISGVRSKRFVFTLLNQSGVVTTVTSDPAEGTDRYPFSYVWKNNQVRIPVDRRSPGEWGWAAERAGSNRSGISAGFGVAADDTHHTRPLRARSA